MHWPAMKILGSAQNRGSDESDASGVHGLGVGRGRAASRHHERHVLAVLLALPRRQVVAGPVTGGAAQAVALPLAREHDLKVAAGPLDRSEDEVGVNRGAPKLGVQCRLQVGAPCPVWDALARALALALAVRGGVLVREVVVVLGALLRAAQARRDRGKDRAWPVGRRPGCSRGLRVPRGAGSRRLARSLGTAEPGSGAGATRGGCRRR